MSKPPYLSIVVNCDTRPPNSEAVEMFSGVVNTDFLTDGIINKVAFFEGFDKEVIVYVDKHQPIPEKVLEFLHANCDTVVIRNHTDEHGFNDYNYLSALFLARGEILVHFDQDTAAFRNSKDYVEQLIKYLDDYKFVSYPSHWTPEAVTDPSFGGFMWASTRFFMCKRNTLRFDDLRKCIEDPDWAYQTFGDRPRKMNWLEHFLTLTTGNSVYYPPVELHKGTIFSWKTYSQYVLKRLNELDYETIKQWILHNGGLVYPADFRCP